MPAYSTTLRNARLDAITAAVGNAGKLALYDGVRPASGGAATNKLAEFTTGTPFAPGAAGGVLSPTLPANTTGLAAAGTGTAATWARLTTSAGVFVADLSVSIAGGGGEVQLAGASANIVNGQPVVVTAWSHTEGNP